MKIITLNIKKTRNSWLLLFVAATYLASCSESKDVGYFSHASTKIVLKTENRNFINESEYQEVGFILELDDIGPQMIEIMSHKQGGYIIFSKDNSSLYYWNEKEYPQQFAGHGRAPDEIELGLRLLKMNNNIYVLQRARISEVICDDNGCTLEVIEAFENVVTYFERKNNGDLIWSDFFMPDRGNLVLETSGQQKFAGAIYYHPDRSLVKYLNFNAVIPLSDDRGYLQKFSLLPYIVLLDNNLEIQEVYEINHFTKRAIKQSGNNNEKYYEFDDSEVSTGSAWFYELYDGKVLLIYAHSKANPLSPHPMDFEIVTEYFDYYTFDPDTKTMEYSGTSENHIIPIKDGFLIQKGYYLYHYKKNE